MADDPASEHELRDHYARMPDGELSSIAADAANLTDGAKALISEEIRRRKLSTPEVPEAESAELEYQPWVTLASFANVNEAFVARSYLESAGISARLGDEVMQSTRTLPIALGAPKLLVKPEDEAVAREILNQPIPTSFDVPGVGTFEQPRCPRCSSLDVRFQGNSSASEIAFPISTQYRAWHCRDCDAEWEEVPDAPELPSPPPRDNPPRQAA